MAREIGAFMDIEEPIVPFADDEMDSFCEVDETDRWEELLDIDERNEVLKDMQKRIENGESLTQ